MCNVRAGSVAEDICICGKLVGRSKFYGRF
jgi:hypothetical protein